MPALAGAAPARRAGTGACPYEPEPPALCPRPVRAGLLPRRVGRTCKKPSRRNRHKRRCKRFVRVRGSFTHRGAAGANSFHFSGRVGGRKLAPGRYRLVGVPRDASGKAGAAVRAKFRIIRSRRARKSH